MQDLTLFHSDAAFAASAVSSSQAHGIIGNSRRVAGAPGTRGFFAMADDDLPTLDDVLVNLRYSAPDYGQQKFKTVLADIDQKAKICELSLTNKATNAYAKIQGTLSNASNASSVHTAASLVVAPHVGQAGLTLGQGGAVKALAAGTVAGLGTAVGLAGFVAFPVLAAWIAAGKVAWTARKT